MELGHDADLGAFAAFAELEDDDTPRKRVLFVDDERNVLEGLERMLFMLADEWEMEFVDSGAEALALIDEGPPIDVIVSDMRMPGMDGATLLSEVQKRQPNVVRIVLSGYSELESAMRAVPVAHQFLSKPCNPEELEQVVSRACGLQDILSDDRLREAVGKVGTLPTRPAVYSELLSVLSDPDVAFDAIGRVVEQDAGMCAKVLQLVNSAFFGLRRKVTSIRQALTYLGIVMIKNLVLSVEVFKTEGGKLSAKGFSMDDEQSHTLLAASIAKRLLTDKRQAEDAFMAAMLHDVGKLVLAAYLPDELSQVLDEVRATGQPLHVVERNLRGVTHAELGAYLLGIWGLPYPIVEAVAHHHQPQRVSPKSFDVLGAVYVANHLARECLGAHDGQTDAAGGLDEEFLAGLEVEHELPEWRRIAEQCAEGHRE